MAAKVRL